MPTIVQHDSDWTGGDAIVLHVYEDEQNGGVSGFTTFALVRASVAELVHTPIGTPVQFAFKSAMEVAAQLGLDHLIINDPGKLFTPD